MMTWIKKKIKGYGPLYHALLWLERFFVAVRSVRVDIFPLREFFVWAQGGQPLGESNYRFYKNFVENIVLNADCQFHFIDIGANDGWFAKTIFRFAPNCRITSYEPLLSQHPYLESLERQYPNFHFRGQAVGDQRGQLSIIEYGTSGLSSLKGISSNYRYSEHYLQTPMRKYSVETVCLDDELDSITYRQSNVKLVLKIDTQGYELEVLRGAENCLRKGLFKWIIVELMTVEKYQGGHLYAEIVDFLHSCSFELWDVNPAYYEPGSYRLTEFDAIFVWKPS